MSSPAAASSACASILVVEDHGPTLLALRALLEPLGQPIVTARSGDEALRHLLAQEFAVILMDVTMPGMSGFDTAEMIRKRERSSKTPIIFLTGVSTDPAEIGRGYSQGAVDYLLKPYNPDILRSKVRVFAELFLAREQARQFAVEQARRAQAETERRRLHELLMQAPVAIMVLRGREQVIELANSRFRRLIGRAQIIGLKAADIWCNGGGRQLLAMLDSVYSGGDPLVATELAILLDCNQAESKEVFFSFNIEPLRDERGLVAGLLVIAVDVSEQVAARRIIEEAVQSRDTFISVVSHELRSPMTTLSIQVDGLLGDVQKGKLTDERAAAKLGLARRQIERMNRLIAELIDATRLSTGEVELSREAVDAAELVREIAQRLAAEAQKVGARIDIDIEESIIGQWDRFRLDQVITNIVTNALRYGEGKPIDITVERQRERAVISVRDRGIGIAKEAQSRIFERFERATSKSAREGLGLGLWIARRIVDALGGRIFVASEPGQGSTFTVELPLV
jgi:signal transduction histidine kinase